MRFLFCLKVQRIQRIVLEGALMRLLENNEKKSALTFFTTAASLNEREIRKASFENNVK